MNRAERLAVSSWSWHAGYYDGRWSLLELPAAAASLGIPAIECNDFMLPPPRLSRVRRPLLGLLPGAPPELWRYSRATLRELAARARAHNRQVLAWTVNSDFSGPAHHQPAQRLYQARGVAAARLLQAPLLRVNLGGSPETSPALDETIARRLAAFVGRAAARYPGVTVTLENHWGVSTDIERHVRLFDRAAALLPRVLRERFGCCFDPANMPPDAPTERLWPELAARANHFHLKTTAAGDDDPEPLPHAELFRRLRECDYRGWVTIEYAGDGPANAAVARSARLFREHFRPAAGPS